MIVGCSSRIMAHESSSMPGSDVAGLSYVQAAM
jgi:hypothetical protein